MTGSGRGRGFVAAFLLCAACSVAPLALAPWPPFVDVPQHAAQVRLWIDLAGGDPSAREAYVLNPFTPYLLGYSLARAGAVLLGVAGGIRAALVLALLGLPAAGAVLLRVLRRDPWWSLALFPLAWGFATWWGFFNYVLALPLGVLFVAGVAAHLRRPRLAGAVAVGLGSLLLFWAHLLVLGAAGLAAGLLGLADLAGHARDRGAGEGLGLRAVLSLGPLLLPLPLMAAWMRFTWSGEAQVRHPLEWGAAWLRPLELPGLLLGGSTDRVAAAVLLLAVAGFALAGVRLRARDLPRGYPLVPVAALVLFLGAPVFAFGTAMLYERFAVLAATFALPLLALRDGRSPRAARAVLLLFALAWSGILAWRMAGYAAEIRDLRAVIAAVPERPRLRYLPVSLRSPRIPEFPVFLQSGAWVQVERGGFLGFSFAQYFPELVRYRETPPCAVPLGREADWRSFRWARERFCFDLFLVHAPRDPAPVLFRGAGDALVTVARAGNWWLYRIDTGDGRRR